MLVSRMLIGICVINLGYGFEGTFQRLGDYQFNSYTLTGLPADSASYHPSGNRFANTWLAEVPVPLPKNYVQGIDLQKVDFETGMYSYLGGTWNDNGWWYFYIYAAAIKMRECLVRPVARRLRPTGGKGRAPSPGSTR